MITYIKISGFKSFQDFEMEFTPLTVIAGTNASGKSNLFDALSLLSSLAEDDLKTAFGAQRGNSSELFTQFGEEWYANEMEFVVEMLVNRMVQDKWGGHAELNNTRLRYCLVIHRKPNEHSFEDLYVKYESLEKISQQEDKWVKKYLLKETRALAKTLRAGGSREPFIKTAYEGDKMAIKIRQDGKQGGKATPADSISQTVLGKINSVDFPHAYAVKEEMRSWKFLKLNPEDLREPTKQEPGMKDAITPSGKNMAAALFRIRQMDEYSITEISRKLNSFLPEFTEVIVSDEKADRQFLIKLKGEDGKYFTSRVLSEGTLRLLALCIMEFDDKHTGLLCFEEPENGIHPSRMKSMMQLLKDLSTDFSDPGNPLRQVIVNTHSPVLVNDTIRWRNDRNVSMHFSQMRTRIKDVGNKRIKLNVTKILPVIIDDDVQGTLNFPEQERKLTLTTVKCYLQSSDFRLTVNELD